MNDQNANKIGCIIGVIGWSIVILMFVLDEVSFDNYILPIAIVLSVFLTIASLFGGGGGDRNDGSGDF